MKKLILSFLLLLPTTACICQNFPPPFGGQMKNTSDNLYHLKAGNLSMTVDLDMGAKILSLKLDDKEIISQIQRREAFGSTFWTSPQREWNWPPVQEFDKKPYTVEDSSATRLVLKSQVSERLKYSVGKEITLEENGQSVVINYSITNEGSETRQVAPWEITRVVNEGVIFFDAPIDSITPAGEMNFEEAHGVVWYQTDEAQRNRKINADATGWLAYSTNGLLLVKLFQDLKAGQPAPNEAEVQVYVNQGKTFIELESQGAYTTLAPGEHLTWTVRWFLLPVDVEGVPSATLVKKVKELVKKYQ